MLEHPKISIIWKFYQAHAKISKLTGATAPVKKVKEISSNGPLQTNQSGTKRLSKPHQVSTILVPPCCYVNDLGLALVPSNLISKGACPNHHIGWTHLWLQNLTSDVKFTSSLTSDVWCQIWLQKLFFGNRVTHIQLFGFSLDTMLFKYILMEGFWSLLWEFRA